MNILGKNIVGGLIGAVVLWGSGASAAAAPLQIGTPSLNLHAPASSSSVASAAPPRSPTALPGAPDHVSPFVFQRRRPSYTPPPAPNESLQAAGRAPVIGPVMDRYGQPTVNCATTPMDAKCR